MMGQLNREQEQLFYSFRLDEVVPEDHLVRAIAAVVDLSWVHAELASYYPKIGRRSIDPVLMIRMLIVGYVFAIRSERRLCSEVQVNLAYRWFCKLGIEDGIPDHSVFSRARHERFRQSDALRRVFEGVVSAAPTRLRGRFLAMFMRTPEMSPAHWPKPRLSNSHAESAKRSRCSLRI